MKTTIEIDEEKLKRVMRLTGARTRRSAVDYALSCTEKAERLRTVFETPLPDEEYRGALDPAYDLASVRNVDRPAGNVDG